MNDSAAVRKAALHEASQWLVRLQDADLSDADLEAWSRWIAASPAHAAAFDDLSALWEASARLDENALARARAQRGNAAPASAPTDAVAGPARPLARRSRRRWLALAAGLGALALAAGWWRFGLPTANDDGTRLATAIGERRSLRLADGSTLDLDAASEVVVRYGKQRRDIELRRGQAFFVVAHAPERPFVVSTGAVRSRALGTRFGVSRRDGGDVVVTVAQGRVQVAAGGSAAAAREAGPDQQIRFSPRSGLAGPRPVNAALASGWREGSVAYQAEPLANVIADINRYSRLPVRLHDPALGNLPVTGRWDVTGLDGWIEGLARALRLEIRRDRDGILLVPARAGKNGPAPAPPPRSDGSH